MTVTWGTIGCGDVVRRKGGPPLWGVANSELAAVMRRNGEAAAAFAREHGVPRWYDTVDALLGDEAVDAVYVASPHAVHGEHTCAAARAGKHVLCEKPMANHAGECDEMIRACADAGVVLAVAYYRRCYPSMRRLKELVDGGAVGVVREIRINDEFPLSHRLDLVHFLAGDVQSVRARVEDLPPGSNAARGPVLYARTVSGATAVTPVGWSEQNVAETVEVTGDAGRIMVDDLKGGRLTRRADGVEKRETFAPLPATHWGIVENFVRHLAGKADLACDGIEGRKSSVILDFVSVLPDDGTTLEVDYDAPPSPDAARASGFGMLG